MTPRGAPLALIRAAQDADPAYCVPWPFACSDNGYAVASFNGRQTYAHIIACTFKHGPKPTEAHETAHNCGLRPCINGSHVRWDTRAGNHADKLIHDTHNRGERHGLHKLTEAEARAILASSDSQYALARRYGVERTTIRRVQSRETWSWL